MNSCTNYMGWDKDMTAVMAQIEALIAQMKLEGNTMRI